MRNDKTNSSKEEAPSTCAKAVKDEHVSETIGRQIKGAQGQCIVNMKAFNTRCVANALNKPPDPIEVPRCLTRQQYLDIAINNRGD